MGELNKNGYKIKTQNEYFDEERALYLNIDANWDLDPSTPDGMKIAHDSEVFSSLDELVKQAYDARDPNKASGYDLDVLRALTGSHRSLGTPSTVQLKLTGVANTIVRAGAKVKTADGVTFLTDEDAIIGLDGTVTVNAHCDKNGAISVSANTLTNIVETVGGWQSVTNPSPATPGTDKDSDAVFRIKSALSVGRAGSNQKESIYGEIFDTTGVRRCRIYENKTNSASVDSVHNPHGLPPHSLAIVVDGGTDQDVAESIYKKLCPGVALHAAGTKVEKTVYSKLFPASYDVITFSRPEYIDISVSVTISDKEKVLPESFVDVVKQSYLDYYEGQLIKEGCGFLTSGFDIGQIVPFTRLFTPANKVLGEYPSTYVSELKVNNSSNDVEIRFNQVARFTKEKIKVVIRNE